MSIKVHIQYSNENINVVEVRKRDRIADLLPKIIKDITTTFEKEKYHFVLDETILENEKLISDYDITEESILVLLKENISLNDYISKCQKQIDGNILYTEILNNIKIENWAKELYNIYRNNTENKITYIIFTQYDHIYYFNDKPFTTIINEISIIEKENNRETITAKKIVPNIICVDEIKEFFKNDEFYHIFALDEKKNKIYLKQNINILNFIKNGILNIYYYNKDIFNELPKEKLIILKGDFKPKDLIDDFFKIFKYNNEKEEEDKYFIYSNSEERKKLTNLFDQLMFDKNLHTFKFAGPKNSGKSTTLLKYSRSSAFVMYFNCRYYHELEKQNKFEKVYNNIKNEFQRINIHESEFISKANILFQKFLGMTYTEIIYEIIKVMKDLKVTRIIILDQVNEKNLKSSELDKYINFIKTKETKIKLIICSSINNYEIEEEVIKSIKYDINFDKGLNLNNQDYYYYCGYLYDNKLDDSHLLFPIYELFRKKKYIYLFEKSSNYSETFSKIKKKIRDDIIKFLGEKDLYLNISDILIFIKNSIKKQIVSIPYQLLKYIPLKYFSIEKISKNNYKLNYDFPYMEYILDNLITIEECDNYFLKKKYELEFLNGNDVKGLYFEYSCIYQINNSEVFCPKLKKFIVLESLSKFDKVIENIEEITINKIKNKNKSKELSKEKTNNLSDNDNNKNISEKLNKSQNNTSKEINNLIMNKNLDKHIDFPKEKKMKKKIFEEINQNIPNLFNIDQKTKSKELKKLTNKSTFEDFKQNLPENLLKEINPYFYDIEYYRKNENLNCSLKKLEGYENENIAFKQKNIMGEFLDYALLIGEQQNKKFLGIQIKCFSPHITTGNYSNETKATIKEKYKNIINRVKNILNVDIKEWHYLLILYYNSYDKEGEPNRFLINHCIINNLEYIFYNPEQKIFIGKNFKDYNKFEFNDLTNLDTLSYNLKYSDIYDYNPDEKVETQSEFPKDYQQYLYDATTFFYQFNNLEEFNETNFGKYLENFSKNISNILNDNKCSFVLLKRIDYKWIPQIPKNYHMSAYVNLNKTNFICLLQINNKVYGIDCQNKRKIDLSLAIKNINFDTKYFYFFKIKKIKKLKKIKKIKKFITN